MLVNVQGFEAKAIAAYFKKTPQILMVHADSPYKSLEDLKGKPIMIGAASRTTFWPFLRFEVRLRIPRSAAIRASSRRGLLTSWRSSRGSSPTSPISSKARPERSRAPSCSRTSAMRPIRH